ncbi:MAG: sigma 54-interacting transcriptional regulator [Pseudomonadota bacterium]|nr:MAG: sigma 54-interacting transcriptional regulator [Pseudomonadota bacterium]
MTYRLAGEHDGQVIRLLIACGESVLGSAGDCALILSLPTVSRRHARLTFADGRLTVEDLDSSNGSRVNGQRLEAATAVKAGDCLQFGDVVLNVESVAEGDDQLGARLDPGETRAAAAEAGLTLAPMALDRLALDHLPQLLTEIGAGLDLPELARQTGEKLWRALPLQWLRITASGAGDPVLFVNGQPQEGQTISRQLGRVGVELAFEQAGLPARAERVFDLIAALLALARDTGHTADRAPKTPPGLPDPAPLDAEMQRIYRRAARAAGSGISVLIRGESGTGKELMARYLHRLSDPDAPFVAINCAALPTDLLESELFGIERGVATGVEERPGCFEQAHGGILFLDEIGDMAAETQARILRVLQEGEVLRVGGSKPRPARPRIISATNRNIEQMVERGLFRIDLLHRIAGWELTLPPLRERHGDIANLALYFLGQYCRERNIRVRGISQRALACLLRYHWPGNVRELQQEMHRVAVFLGDGDMLASEDLRAAIRNTDHAETGTTLEARMAVAERTIIRQTMAETEGNMSRAAEQLGIARSTLYRRMAQLGLESD